MTEPEGRPLFRRRFRAMAEKGRCTAEVEDDHHHMAVTVIHDGVSVTEVRGSMTRSPYDTCPGAAALLGQLIGAPITARYISPPGLAAREHCTHLLDTAILAISQAARGGERRYEFQVPDLADGRTAPRVLRDGREVLSLELADDVFVAPEPFVGQTVRAMMPWAERTLDDDTLEIVRLLRRVLMVARGWQLSGRSDRPVRNIAMSKLGACFTLQEERLPFARPLASQRALSDRPDLFTLPL